MAATRLIALHQHKGRTVAQSLGERTDYAKNPEKTEKGETVTSFGCDPYTVDEEFMLQKRQYYQTTGKKQHSDVIAYQIRQSFKPGEITAEEANRVGYELAYAERFGKPAHVFYRKDVRLSAMLTGDPYFQLHPYEEESEIYPILDSILHSRGTNM